MYNITLILWQNNKRADISINKQRHIAEIFYAKAFIYIISNMNSSEYFVNVIHIYFLLYQFLSHP